MANFVLPSPPKHLQLFLVVVVLSGVTIESSRITRAVMMSVPNIYLNCSDLTIMGKNQTAKVILTGTVTNCAPQRAGSYKCRLQVWRVMKGNRLTSDLIEQQGSLYVKKRYMDVYGLGNSAYCESNVKNHDTRIFFLNRENNRFILAASLLRITLANLQNTQAVIEGQRVEEPPKKPYDPCQAILCGFGAGCEIKNGVASCVCPDLNCPTSDDGDDLLAPVCGSDGVTYANECSLKDVQCMTQRGIKTVAQKACELDCEGKDRGSELCPVATSAPVVDASPCSDISCSFFAQCVVKAGPGPRNTPTCVCPTCDDASFGPVCGSDLRSYSSECELRRRACIQATDIEVVKKSACDPCSVYNESSKEFESHCPNGCLLVGPGQGQCCSDISCSGDDFDVGPVCGSDGNNYESECAMRRYACRTAKTISLIQSGFCPKQKASTTVRGSMTLSSGCPGNCDPSNAVFEDFITSLESAVDQVLLGNSGEEKVVRSFRVARSATSRNTIFFTATASTSSEPIRMDDTPEDRYAWVGERLVDEALAVALHDRDIITNADVKESLLVEDVCLNVQCEHGAACLLNSRIEPTCSCGEVGVGDKQPINMRCRATTDGDWLFNMNDVKASMCESQSFYALEDICESPPSGDPCADIGGCVGSGEVCTKMNGESRCECLTCNDENEPVCGSDGQTYRSRCELLRQNCLSGSDVEVRHTDHCDDQCKGVKCWHGAQCVLEAEGTVCVCPDHCVAVHSPVCGSDCVTYNNECEMMVDACQKKYDVTVAYRGACNEEECAAEMGSGSEEEGSGSLEEGSGREDGCRCRFGAHCDGTDDDEDAACVCSFDCDAQPTKQICGADGRTYMNRCEHKRAECEKQFSIPVLGIGSCADVCRASRYGCCEDGITQAVGPGKAGCPEICACNPHGSYTGACDSAGQCVCRPGVGGKKCDRCQPGFWNFRAIAHGSNSGCMACRCHEFGSGRDDCDQMSGQCSCKEGVVGTKCSKCAKDDSWVDAAACTESTGSSCLACPPGQECFDVGGVLMCRCPTFAECKDFKGSTVCGSDGLTYTNACQMKVMTCKQGLLVRVVEQGRCKGSSVGEPPSIDLTTTTTQPVTTTTRTTTSTSTIPDRGDRKRLLDLPKSLPPPSTTQGSAGIDCGLMDDEDCYGSGGGDTTEKATSTTVSTTTSRIGDVTTSTPMQIDKSFNASAESKEIDGVTLEYDEELADPDSLLYDQYSRSFTSKITKYLADSSLAGKVKAFRILSIEDNIHWFWGSNGIKVQLSVTYDPSSNPTEIVDNLNLLPDSDIDFSLPSEPSGTKADLVMDNETLHYREDDEWFLPQFGGFSFMEFPPLENPYSRLTIKIRFRTFDSEGLLLFACQSLQDGTSKPLQDGASKPLQDGDFVSIAIKNGFVQLRFDAGNGPLILSSNINVTDGRWHDVVAHRNRREGVLKVDTKSVTGTSPAGAVGLDVRSNLFFGGFPSDIGDRIRDKVGIGKGLTGCVASLSVKDVPIPISSADAENRTAAHRIGQCSPSPCSPNPCSQHANCFILQSDGNFTSKCECRNGFKGENCSGRVEGCRECHPSSSCRRDAENFTCECAPGRSGPLCMHELNLSSDQPSAFMPGFAADSYLIKPTLGDAVRKDLEIILVFYSSQPNGLIFYNAQKKSGKGDHISLSLSNRYLRFIYDLGSGALVIRSTNPVELDTWHEVHITQKLGNGEMSIDGESPVTGKAPSGHTLLNLRQPLYLGGIPRKVKTPPVISMNPGLTGTIQKFEFNDKVVDLQSNEESYNVQPFNAHPCYHNPCSHGGRCRPQLGGYTCECTGEWSGEHCEDEI